MKYYFGKYNNCLQLDKYNRVNKQVQFLIDKGYIFSNGGLSKPEKKELIVVGSNPVVEGMTVTIDKSGWYCPSDLVGSNFFVHEGKLKKVIDFNGLVSQFDYDTLYSEDSEKIGNSCYSFPPNSWLEIKDIIFEDGIRAIKIDDTTYDNHIFLLSNFNALVSVDDFYRLYIFEILEEAKK